MTYFHPLELESETGIVRTFIYSLSKNSFVEIAEGFKIRLFFILALNKSGRNNINHREMKVFV